MSDLHLFFRYFFGLEGVLYSMPVSDILTFAVALILIVRTYKQLGAGTKSERRSGTAAELVRNE